MGIPIKRINQKRPVIVLKTKEEYNEILKKECEYHINLETTTYYLGFVIHSGAFLIYCFLFFIRLLTNHQPDAFDIGVCVFHIIFFVLNAIMILRIRNLYENADFSYIKDNYQSSQWMLSSVIVNPLAFIFARQTRSLLKELC